MRQRLFDALMTTLVIGALLGVGVLMATFGLGRATRADVQAVETRIAERCGS